MYHGTLILSPLTRCSGSMQHAQAPVVVLHSTRHLRAHRCNLLSPQDGTGQNCALNTVIWGWQRREAQQREDEALSKQLHLRDRQEDSDLELARRLQGQLQNEMLPVVQQVKAPFDLSDAAEAVEFSYRVEMSRSASACQWDEHGRRLARWKVHAAGQC